VFGDFTMIVLFLQKSPAVPNMHTCILGTSHKIKTEVSFADSLLVVMLDKEIRAAYNINITNIEQSVSHNIIHKAKLFPDFLLI